MFAQGPGIAQQTRFAAAIMKVGDQVQSVHGKRLKQVLNK
jgi:hypothetical protein